MANLIITNDCPRSCTFCFAKSRLGSSSRGSFTKTMSLEKIEKIMDLLERSGEKNLRLLGGEPTRHPQFEEIVDKAIQKGFVVHIFTNCMMPKKTVDFLASLPDMAVTFLANVSKQPTDTEKQLEMVDYALSQLSHRIQVGMTLTSPDFEYEYLIEMIEKHKLKRNIRVGIAQPIVGEQNAYLHPKDYRAAGRSIVTMAKACEARNILIGFDCGMTLCMFSEEELGVIMKRSEGLRMVCNPIIDIGPDLDIWHCFPLSEVLNTNLEKFQTRNDIVQFYQRVAGPYRAFGCKTECLSCKYMKRGQCNGGCLAHAMNSLNKLPPRQAPEIKQ